MHTAIIFDFFDVIHSDPYHAWLKIHGLKDDGEQARVNDAVDLDEITMREHYAGLGKVTGQSAQEVEAEFLASEQVDNEVVALITELKQHFTIALVSNAPSDYLREIITRHDLRQLFDHIIISGEVGLSKPDPRIFLHVLEKLGAKPAETIFIDDNPQNVAAATTLGIVGIVHTDAHSLRQALLKNGVTLEI